MVSGSTKFVKHCGEFVLTPSYYPHGEKPIDMAPPLH